MPEIFRKNITATAYHPRVCNKLDDLSKSSNTEDQAVLENLRIDDRVNQTGLDHFLRFSNSRNEPLTFDLREYSCRPASARATELEENLIYKVGQPDSPSVADNTELVTVIRLFERWTEYLHNWILEELNKPSSFDQLNLDDPQITEDTIDTLRKLSGSRQDVISKWLELAKGRFGGIPELIKISLVESYAKATGGTRPDRLTWTGLWSEFERFSRSSTLTWLEVFGLGQFAFPENLTERSWFLVLKYTVFDCEQLFQPTVLQAGVNPWHFPVPAKQIPAKGGKTVIFGDSLSAGVDPLSEFVHYTFSIRPTDIWAVDSYLPDFQAQSASQSELMSARNIHRSRIPRI